MLRLQKRKMLKSSRHCKISSKHLKLLYLTLKRPWEHTKETVCLELRVQQRAHFSLNVSRLKIRVSRRCWSSVRLRSKISSLLSKRTPTRKRVLKLSLKPQQALLNYNQLTTPPLCIWRRQFSGWRRKIARCLSKSKAWLPRQLTVEARTTLRIVVMPHLVIWLQLARISLLLRQVQQAITVHNLLEQQKQWLSRRSLARSSRESLNLLHAWLRIFLNCQV